MMNQTKRHLSLFPYLLCLLIITTACSQSKERTKAKKQAIMQTRNATEFDRIIFNGNGNIYISQGEEESLKIEGEEELLEMVSSLVIEKTLRIEYKKSNMQQLLDNTKSINIYIQVKSLQEVRLAGAGDIISTTPLKVHTLKLSLAGIGNAEIQVSGHKLFSILSGSGRFHIEGIIENQDIWINGNGIYDAPALISHVANINISGSGTVSLNVTDDLDVRISGAGNIIYDGEPNIRQSISGTGKIGQKKTDR